MLLLRVPLPIVGPDYKSRSLPVSPQTLINLLLTASDEGKPVLDYTPGLSLFADISSSPVRGMVEYDSTLHAVVGTSLYSVNSTGLDTSLGTIPGTDLVSMESNGDELLIVNGANGYTWDGATLAQIADADFEDTAETVAFLGGYFLFPRPDSGEFFISALYDGTAYDALDFATAEGSPDKLVTLLVNDNVAWLFGDKSIEVWYQSGDTFPFSPIPGALTKGIGCGAKRSPAAIAGNVCWLGQDNMVYRSNGYKPIAAANPGVAAEISSYSTTSDAVGYIYQEEGAYYYVLSFPTANKTWCLDLVNGQWHQRRSSRLNDRFLGQLCINIYGKNFVADHSTGKIYEMSRAYTDEAGVEMVRERSWQHLRQDGKSINMGRLEVVCQTGASGSTEQFAMLDWSDDGGHTYGYEAWASIGTIGQYLRRAVWTQLGSFYDRVFRLRIATAGKVSIIEANADIEVGL